MSRLQAEKKIRDKKQIPLPDLPERRKWQTQGKPQPFALLISLIFDTNRRMKGNQNIWKFPAIGLQAGTSPMLGIRKRGIACLTAALSGLSIGA